VREDAEAEKSHGPFKLLSIGHTYTHPHYRDLPEHTGDEYVLTPHCVLIFTAATESRYEANKYSLCFLGRP